MKHTLQTLIVLILGTTLNAMALSVPTAPINAGAYDFTATSARLSFKDMSDNEEGFRVYHEGKVLGSVGAKEGSGEYHYISLVNLTPATLYTVNIVAFNRAGESESLIKSFRTTASLATVNEGVPAQPDTYIGVWGETQESARISFKDNANNELGFRIEDIEGNVLLNNIPPKEGSGHYQYVTLSGLKAGTLYQIRIFAYNAQGDSLPTGVRAFRTKPATELNTTTTSSCDMETAITRDELRDKIANGEDITEVNTCAITDMSQLFYLPSYTDLSEEQQLTIQNFNQDISGWDVSHVTDMSLMFAGTKLFNQDIGEWNVSSVTNMMGMFGVTVSFNQDLSRWDTSSVTNMDVMFFLAMSFYGQDLTPWDVHNVTSHDSFATGWAGSIEPLWRDELHYWIETYNSERDTAQVHFIMEDWNSSDQLMVDDAVATLDSGSINDGYLTLANGRHAFKACDVDDPTVCSETFWVDVARAFDAQAYQKISILETTHGMSHNGEDLLYGTISGKIYRLDLENNESILVHDVQEKISGLIYLDEENYYYSNVETHLINRVNVTIGVKTPIASLFFPDGLDIYNDHLYSVAEDQNGTLLVFDLAGNQTGILKTSIDDIVGIAHTDNFLYVLSEDGHIYQVNPTTAEVAKVFSNTNQFSGGNTYFGLEGITILNNTIYLSYVDDTSIYKIDLDITQYE